MATSLDEEADRTIRRLLRDNWEPSNTAGYGPDSSHADQTDLLPIHFGNYDSELADPQISLNQTQGEFTVGNSRWSGKNSATGGMNQFRRGMVIVQGWAVDKQTYNNGLKPDGILPLIRREVERVVGLFEVSGPESGSNSDKIHSFSSEWNGRIPKAQGDDTNVTWQTQMTITYDWTRESQ